MDIDPPRQLTREEHELVQAMVNIAVPPFVPMPDLSTLRVVETCDCGCGSFEMEPNGIGARSATYGRQLADGYGVTPDGRSVGLLLWGIEHRLVYLELYSLAALPPFSLPAPNTVTTDMPWPDPTA